MPSDKKTIALCAALKPINDTRMYKKFACSLSNRYQVHCFGYKASPLPTEENIVFHPVFDFGRTAWLKRLWQGFRLIAALQPVKPDVLICHAIELMPWCVLYKLIYGGKLIYDIRENYMLNVLHQQVYAAAVKAPIAFALKMLHRMAVRFSDLVILAERVYAAQLPLANTPYIIVENKSLLLGDNLQRKIKLQPSKDWRFLVSGTLSEAFGIYEAMDFCRRALETYPQLKFVFCGKSAKPETLEQLNRFSETHHQVNLITSLDPIPHQEIEKQIQACDIMLLPYPKNPSTEGCIPTKLYEALSLHKPMLIQVNAIWEELCKPYPAAVFADLPTAPIASVITELEESYFYRQNASDDASWDGEGSRLLGVISKHIQ